MAQTEPPRPQYPPPEDNAQAGYYAQQQHSPQRGPARDERGHYPPSEQHRQGQYPPADSRGPPPGPYPPPGQWAGQQHSAYPPHPPQHYQDPQHAGYPYPPPRHDMSQPPQPIQPNAYQLPPPYPHYGYQYPPAPPAAPAPRQRTAIACKYCRKRKIRCSGYDSSPDGRCQNCVRFNQQCLFHPVSSQAAFIPASAVYGPNARAPVSGDRPGENGQYRNGDQPPMLYGAHGQPLGPAGPSGHPQYQYPPPGYPPQGYHYPPQHYPPGPPGQPYEQHGQGNGQGPSPQSQDERVSLKRPLSDEDPHNENSHTSQSPHPNAKPRNSMYDSRANSGSSFSYPDPSNLTPTSPATSIMSHQSYPPQPYANGNAHKGNTPPAGLTPNSAHSFHSPHNGPVRDDGKTPPPGQPGSAGSSVNGRSGMKVHEMLGNHNSHSNEQRAKNDNDMLSKLDRKK